MLLLPVEILLLRYTLYECITVLTEECCDGTLRGKERDVVELCGADKG